MTAAVNPERTIFDVKRLIGRNHRKQDYVCCSSACQGLDCIYEDRGEVVCNANKLTDLVKKKNSKQNWLDYYQLKYSRNQSVRLMMKGFHGICGDKVDDIEYHISEIGRLSKEVTVLP